MRARVEARAELRRAIPILREHGLKRSAKFCAEQLAGLREVGEATVGEGMDVEAAAAEESSSESLATLRLLESGAPSDAFLLAQSFFDCGEFVRAAVAISGVGAPGGPLPAAEPAVEAAPRDVFLWAYALYLAGEKRKEEEALEGARDAPARARARNAHCAGLRDALRRRPQPLRGLEPYALGMVLKELAAAKSAGGFDATQAWSPPARAPADSATGGDFGDEDSPAAEASDEAYDALAALKCATRLFPWNWSAWLDVAEVGVHDSGRRASAQRSPTASSPSTVPADADAEPQRWATPAAPASQRLVGLCFEIHVAIDRQQCENGLRLLADLAQICPTSTYVVAQTALAHYARRDFDAALLHFERLRAQDPYRLDEVDIYSNVLYVKEARAELSRLAHSSMRAEKYRAETCCVVGNYYSLKAQHERAVLYFRRALQLDRKCLSAWTLMGHEFIEMKNTAAAIEAYRRAVDVNARDYRAWYGLGQTYEILNMHFYALYYYRKAARLRPLDARMWIAIAQCHEKLHRVDDAIKGYERAAANDDDADGHATLRLAKLHRARHDGDAAAACYQRYVDARDAQSPDVVDSTAEALLFLAQRHKQKSQFQEAQAKLARLLDFSGPEKLEAQAMLREIRSMAEQR
ncbi:hypothetical protein M885DRAFT_471139 [Pelagophyceae sp. CCMP2097]|nr:hypothetical protein M885DRAFT_471139 [Pelagophyceae sp. CCMP2097]